MSDDRFQKIDVGDEAEIFHTITANDLDSFAELTGDINPLHMDDSYAATTSFKKRVVHGMLTASFISTMIGTKLPGKGSLWYEQQLRFLAPARIGEKIRVWAKVKHKSLSQRILTIETLVFGDGGKKLIEGEAKVKVLKPEKKEVPKFEIKEKGAVIITGASRGIGAAIAKELALTGYPVIVNYAKSTRQAEDIVRHIKAQKGKAAAFQANVSNADSVKAMADFAIEEFGGTKSVLAVTPFPAPIEWSFERSDNGELSPLQPGKFAIPSHDLGAKYYDGGAFAFFPAHRVLRAKGTGDDTNFVGYILQRDKAIDIDNKEDWVFAEVLYLGRKQQKDTNLENGNSKK